METRKGFEFVCEILETIITEGEEYQIIKYARENGNKIEKKYIESINKLIRKWKEYSKSILISYNKIVPEEWEVDEKKKNDAQQMLDDYVDWLQFSEENNTSNRKDYVDFRDDIKKYINGITNNSSVKKNKQEEGRRDRLNIERAFQSILMEHKTTEDAFSAGVALTIALTVGNEEPLGEFFFIEREEQINILFQSLKVLGIDYSEFVPDEQFGDAENMKDFRLLLMYALHNALKVMLPRKQSDIEGHLKRAKFMWENQPTKISGQKLFAAIGTAKETASICETCKKGMREYCQKEEVKSDKTEYLELTSFYQIPILCSIQKTREDGKKGKLLISERGYQIRVLIQGKSGIGKTLLGKATVLASLAYKDSGEGNNVLTAYAEALGINQEYFPLFLECGKLSSKEKEQLNKTDWVKLALTQMYGHAKSNNWKKCLAHWDYCEASFITYCRRKAKEGKLLLLLDDYPQIAKNLEGTFEEQYNVLSDEYPGIHTVFLSNFLVKSEIRKYIDKKFEIFAIEDFSIEKLKTDSLCSSIGVDKGILLEKIEKDYLAKEFVDTPRRFMEYAVSESVEKKDLADIIQDCVETELGAQSDVSKYKDFFVQLWKVFIKKRERQSEKIVLSGKLFESNQAKEFEDKMSVEKFEAISTSVREESILIERSSENVNSFEFKNSTYLYSLIAEHTLDYMADVKKEKECAGEIQSIFKQLRDEEVSCVIELMLNRMVKAEYNINESGLETFFRELVSRMVYCNSVETLSCLYGIIDAVLHDYGWQDSFRKKKYPEKMLGDAILALEKLNIGV